MIAAIVLMSLAVTASVTACPAVPMASSLGLAVGQTLTSVRSGNANALLMQMSPKGVAFGAEGGIVPHASLRDGAL